MKEEQKDYHFTCIRCRLAIPMDMVVNHFVDVHGYPPGITMEQLKFRLEAIGAWEQTQLLTEDGKHNDK